MDSSFNMGESPAVAQESRKTRRSRLWLVAALLFVLFWALPNLSQPISRDQAMYCVIGDGLLQGQRLYRDLWDNRPPATAYVFAAIGKAFGPVMWSIGLVDILWLLGVSYFAFRFAARYLGTAVAVLAVGVNAIWHCRAGYVHAAVPSTFVILFVLAGFFLAEREGPWPRLRDLAAGLLLGAAFWATYNALLLFPLLVLVPYLDTTRLDHEPRRVRLAISWSAWLPRAAFVVAGFAAAVAVVTVYLWLTGSWAAFWEINFAVMPRYAALGFKGKPGYWLWAIVQTQHALGAWTELATLAALLIAWKRRELGRLSPILLAAGLGYVSAAIQVRFRPYYFEICYPFFAMIWGYVTLRIYESFRALAAACVTRGWRLARLLVWVLFANVVAWPVPEQATRLALHYRQLEEWGRQPEISYMTYLWPHTLEHLGGEMGVIRYLKENSAPRDGVFVWGTQPLIYFLSQRRPPTRFLSNLGLISAWAPASWQVELVRDLQASPPRFVVVVRGDAIPSVSGTNMDSEKYLSVFPKLAAFIADSYQPVTTIGNFVVYSHREISRTQTPASSNPSLK